MYTRGRCLRFHVEDVAHAHAGFTIAVPLSHKLLLGPGHVDPVGAGGRLVIQGGVGLCVPVMDQLSLCENKNSEVHRHVRQGIRAGPALTHVHSTYAVFSFKCFFD